MNYNEEWKCIDEFNKYYISNYGNVKRFTKGKFKPCKTYEKNGYECIILYYSMFNCKNINTKIHRLVAKYFVYNKNGDTVNHINFNKKDNRASNLEWVSIQENIKHFYKYGHKNTCKGVNKKNAKLKDEYINQIKDLHKNGNSCSVIAKKYNVSETVIRMVVTNKIWKHVI